MDASAFNTKPSVISDDLRRYMDGLLVKPRSALKFDQGADQTGFDPEDAEPSASELLRDNSTWAI